MNLPPPAPRPVTELPADILITFEERRGYLYAQVAGPRDSRAISTAYWMRIAAQCEASRCRKLMVVENLGDYEGERDMADMVDAILAMGLGRLKVAFVTCRVQEMARLEHGEILAIERGANGRVFGSTALAEHWLHHGGE